MMYILFICITVPLIMMALIVDKKSKLLLGFMTVGCFVCLLASELNTLVSSFFYERGYFFITTTITPTLEELLKALPILFFAIAISDDRRTLMNISMATGIGFAIIENTYMLIFSASSVSIGWALVRGLGAGLLHGICTLMVGYGISFIRKSKEFFYPGVFGLLTTAIIYHAIYNSLVQSDYAYWGYYMPLITFIIILAFSYVVRRRYRKLASNQQAK